jgi:hypothetical protein
MDWRQLEGVVAVQRQVLQTPVIRKLHKQKILEHRRSSTPPMTDHPDCKPGMTINSELIVERITDPSNPACNSHGLFTRADGNGIPAGTVLGEYVGEVRDDANRMEMTRISYKTEYLGDGRAFASACKTNTADDEYALQLDLASGWAKGIEGTALTIDARIHRSEMAFVNDPRGMEELGIPDRTDNTEFVEKMVDGWPHMFLQTIVDVPPGTELLVCRTQPLPSNHHVMPLLTPICYH